jgi:regulatory protein
VDAFTRALTLLGQRELSEAQVRTRLARRRFDADAIDDAVARLKADGTLDDRRVAVAAARLESAIRGRGRSRVIQRVRALGIAADVAEDAVAEVFSEVDEAALLDQALTRRLKGRSAGDFDRKARARIVRALIAQGFAPGAVLARLRDPQDD